jgi:50S ribosomal subunit-associated GTPase HflX
MMSAEEITQSVLRFLEIITQWSVIFVVIVLLLRRQLAELLIALTRVLMSALPRLIGRMKKVSVGSASAEFSPEAITAFKETVETEIDQRREQPDQAIKFIEKQLEKLVQTIPQERPSRPLDGRSILWVDDNPAGKCL